MNTDKFYTLEELSKTLNVSIRTLHREIKRKRIKTSRVGRRHLISQESLDHYLNRTGDINNKIKEFCESHKQDMVNLLQKLVSISSESETAGEEKLAEYIKSVLDDHNIRNSIYGHGESVAIHATFGYGEPGLLLDCPLDTTPAGDVNKWTYPPFEGIIKNGKMYGRGTADCKSGIVAMIFAVLALKKFVDEDKIRVELVFDGGEQNGSYFGMKETIKKGLLAKSGIIGYAGSFDEISIGARGYHRFTFTTHGQSAHTGSRQKSGVSAISNMIEFISAMEKLKLPRSQNKYFYFGSRLIFPIIHGGNAINVVPDTCQARMDFRVVPELKKTDVEKIIKQVINSIKKKNRNFEIDYVYDVGEEAYVLKDNHQLIKSLNDSIKTVLNKDAKKVVNGPAHIGNLLYKYNIPMVVFGAEGGNVHGYDEYVKLDSLPKTAEIYAKTALNYFGF